MLSELLLVYILPVLPLFISTSTVYASYNASKYAAIEHQYPLLTCLLLVTDAQIMLKY
jgi:hypothetical protein